MKFGVTIALAMAALAGMAATAEEGKLPRQDGQFMRDVLGLDPGRSTFDQNVPKYLQVFRENSVDGAPGYSPTDRKLALDSWAAEIRAKRLEKFLSDDLNNDQIVDVEEVRVRLLRTIMRRLGRDENQEPPDQEELERKIEQQTETYLNNFDLDGDRKVSLAEASVKAREIGAHARATTAPVPRMTPTFAHDTDGDGIISEAEMLGLARELFEAYDADGDGQIQPKERQSAYALIKKPPPFMFPGTPSGACRLPSADNGLETWVIGGYEGAAMSDVHFGDPSQAVEVADITVAEQGAPLRLVISLHQGTILRVEDPGRRVSEIVDTRGPLGVIGAPGATLLKAPDDCHVELWKGMSTDLRTTLAFYRSVLGKEPAGMIAAYTLGKVDLETRENLNRVRFADSLAIPLDGPAGPFWTHFSRFNPGGLIEIDPNAVRYSGRVARHTIWPQHAGLARLVKDNALQVLERSGEVKGVKGTQLSVSIGGQRFLPGGGDDAIFKEGLIYRYERPGRWIGRTPYRLRVEAPFSYPGGLTGAHGVQFILPQGMVSPTGDPGTSRLVPEREQD